MSRWHGLLFFALASLLGACGGIGPGDYVVYRIAFQDTKRSADCYGSPEVPIDEKDDSSSLFVAGTFVLYVGADETPYLDIGTTTLKGSDEGGGAYQFAGNSVDVEVIEDPNDPTMELQRISTTVDTSVEFDTDGAVVDGVYQKHTKTGCSGMACPDPPSTQCTETTNFVGSEIEDVDLEHQV